MSHEVNRTARSQLTSRLVMLLGITMLAGGLSGCNIARGVQDYVSYNTPAEDFVTGWRDRVWANRSYNDRRDVLNPPRYEADFRKGFIAGYRNISQGGQGCTPSLPPRTYWSWRYQSAEGQAKVAAWFSGFPHGARAAEEDGVGNYYQIQVASWLDGQGYDTECPDCLDPVSPDGGIGGIEEIMPGFVPDTEPIPDGVPIPMDPSTEPNGNGDGIQLPGSGPGVGFQSPQPPLSSSRNQPIPMNQPLPARTSDSFGNPNLPAAVDVRNPLQPQAGSNGPFVPNQQAPNQLRQRVPNPGPWPSPSEARDRVGQIPLDARGLDHHAVGAERRFGQFGAEPTWPGQRSPYQGQVEPVSYQQHPFDAGTTLGHPNDQRRSDRSPNPSTTLRPYGSPPPYIEMSTSVTQNVPMPTVVR